MSDLKAEIAAGWLWRKCVRGFADGHERWCDPGMTECHWPTGKYVLHDDSKLYWTPKADTE